jgi:hypothetical protein
VADEAKALAKKIKEQKYQEYTSDQDENFGDVDEEDDDKLMEKYRLIRKKEELNKTAADLSPAVLDNKI